MSDPETAATDSFESHLRKLEDLVRRMEGGTLTLDQMLKSFEEGSRLRELWQLMRMSRRGEREEEGRAHNQGGQRPGHIHKSFSSFSRGFA